MKNRRKFLVQFASVLSTLPLLSAKDMTSNLDKADLWKKVRRQFPISKYKLIQLNNGSAGVMPNPVMKILIEYIKELNSMPPYEAWKKWEAQKQLNKKNLAKLINAEAEEISIMRNTTEALDNIIFGLDLDKKDEVILARHDYPFVWNAFRQRVKRDHIRIKEVAIKLPYSTDDEIVDAYEKAINSRTKILMLTYITHRQGHIMPVQRIVEVAHKKGVKVILDAAHAYGQIVHDVKQLGCDFYATSLHKWLAAPHGTGLLYIKKDLIGDINPLLSSDEHVADKMTKFEYLGTRAFHQEIGIGAALAFQESIGLERKQQRLHFLKKYWTDQIKDLPRVGLLTDTNSLRSCATASFYIEEGNIQKILDILESDYKIHAKIVGTPNRSSIRISPNIFNTTKELDLLVKAIKSFV